MVLLLVMRMLVVLVVLMVGGGKHKKCLVVPQFLMVWHIIRHLPKKLGDLDENCPSNRQNQNCDYLLIFCPSIPTVG